MFKQWNLQQKKTLVDEKMKKIMRENKNRILKAQKLVEEREKLKQERNKQLLEQRKTEQQDKHQRYFQKFTNINKKYLTVNKKRAETIQVGKKPYQEQKYSKENSFY